MRFGQVEQLLDARAEAHAEPLAAAERDQRVRELVALAVRIGPRIHEADDALHPVGRATDQQHEARPDQQHDQPANSRQFMPPRNRMPNAIAVITTNAPKSGSRSSSAADRQHHDEHRQEAARVC